MGKNSQIHLYLETQLHRSLKGEAKNRGITLSNLCRQRLKGPEFDLKELAFNRLKNCDSKNGIIYFKKIWVKLCTNFSIKKEQCWKLLREFENDNKINFVCGKGIRILAK